MRTKRDWTLHGPGIEPGPPAWQARILPLNHPCHGLGCHLTAVTACAPGPANSSSPNPHPTPRCRALAPWTKQASSKATRTGESRDQSEAPRLSRASPLSGTPRSHVNPASPCCQPRASEPASLRAGGTRSKGRQVCAGDGLLRTEEAWTSTVREDGRGGLLPRELEEQELAGKGW